MPPEAITGTGTARTTARNSSRSGPARVPSRSQLVSKISPAPSPAPSSAHSTASARASTRPPRTSASQRSPLRRASMASTTHWQPNWAASSDRSAGRSMAAVFTLTLSAPAASRRRASSTLRTPPPTVRGMRIAARTHATVSSCVARPSGDAATSSTTISSAPWASYAAPCVAGSPASRRSWNRTPFTTRPSRTSRQGTTRGSSPGAGPAAGGGGAALAPVSQRCNRPAPYAPDSSGWNWQASTRSPSFSSAATNRTPWVVHATVQPAGASRRAYEFANAAIPVAMSPCSDWAVTVFQPRCGTRTSAGSRRQVPAITPSPATPGVSSLASHSICMPRQMPRRGVPRATTSVIAASRPCARSAPSPAPNAPTPGSTTRDACRTAAGSRVTATLAPSRPNPLVIDARLATPESTMTTSAIERPLGGRHVVVAGAGDRLLQGEGRRLERSLGLVMIVLALEHVDVQRQARRDGERAQHVRDVLAREPPDRLPSEVERDVGVGAPRQIDDRAGQGVVERREGRPEPRHTAALAQGAVERLPQREGTVLGGVVIIDVEVALAGERHVQPGMAPQRVEQMVEEADAGLYVDRAGSLEGERDGDRR